MCYRKVLIYHRHDITEILLKVALKIITYSKIPKRRRDNTISQTKQNKKYRQRFTNHSTETKYWGTCDGSKLRGYAPPSTFLTFLGVRYGIVLSVDSPEIRTHTSHSEHGNEPHPSVHVTVTPTPIDNVLIKTPRYLNIGGDSKLV